MDIENLTIIEGQTKRIRPQIGLKFGNYTIIDDVIATDGKRTY